MDLTDSGITLICVRTAESVSYAEWQSISDALKNEYSDSAKVIVTRDAMIYHRVKNIKNRPMSREYIAETIKLAESRDG